MFVGGAYGATRVVGIIMLYPEAIAILWIVTLDLAVAAIQVASVI